MSHLASIAFKPQRFALRLPRDFLVFLCRKRRCSKLLSGLITLAFVLLGVSPGHGKCQQEIVYETDNLPVDNYSSEWDGFPVEENLAGSGSFIEQTFLQLAPEYSREMLNFQNRQTNKEILLLEHAQLSNGEPNLTLGAQFRASALYGKTNTADKFSYLGRFPTDFEGRYASDLRLLQANQAGSLSFGPTAHAYFETLFSDVFSFGSFKQGSYQVRQAYVVIGDLSRTPWYGFIGKKNVGFGDMSTLSPFSQAMTWHYFAALAEGGGVGFDNGVVSASFTALNGSRGIRVSDSSAKGDLNNFAANILFRLPFAARDGEFHVGGGYLYGTIYNASVAEHLDPDLFGDDNPAWDVNAYLRIRRLHLAAEYIQTVNPWPVTNHEVIAYRTEAAYDTFFRAMPARWSLSWSEGVQGQAGTQFEFNRQIVVGYQIQPHQNATISLEYVRSSGFAPLIEIQRVSDIDVIQDSMVLGLTLTL